MTPKFKTDERGRILSLEGVCVGDKFVYLERRTYSGETRQVVFCEKITKTQCVIGEKRYRISDAFLIGERARYSCTDKELHEFNAKAMDEYRRAENLKRTRAKLKETDWQNLPKEKIHQVAAIVFGESQ